ncbi:MAG: AAA family ATPase [Pseudanabaena sp. ELA645]|jgi:predicted ATPase
MLESVELQNFKSHRLTSLNFDNSRLHALVGRNSSGKTSVLQALHYLSRLAGSAHSSFADIFQCERSPEFITTIGQTRMSVTARGGWGDKRTWEASYAWIQSVNQPWLPITSCQVDNEEIRSEHGWTITLGNAPYPIPEVLKDAIHLKIVAANLAKAAYSDELIPRVEFDGSGLAPTLDNLRNEDPDKFADLHRMLQRIVPSIERIWINRAEVIVNRQRLIQVDGKSISYEDSDRKLGQEIFLDMNTGKRIPAHAISEGTMLTLGLLTVLMNPKQPNLVLLDDIEQGLHPKAQRDLVAVFKEIIEDNPNLQIIFSTHSPYIIDELTPSQVHVLSNSNLGFTSSKRLDEHPDVEWAKQTLTTGEFWDAEGEDWVIDGDINE